VKDSTISKFIFTGLLVKRSLNTFPFCDVSLFEILIKFRPEFMPDPETTTGRFLPIFLVAILMNPSVPHFSAIPSEVAFNIVSTAGACPLQFRIKRNKNKTDTHTFFIFNSLLNNYYS